MPTEYILLLLTFTSLSVGCCINRHQIKKTAHQEDPTHLHYKAVEGETFMMPCIKSSNQYLETVWSRTGEGGGGNKGPPYPCGNASFLAEAKHSGKYTDLTGKLIFHLKVVEKLSVGCSQPEEKSSVTVFLTTKGVLSCPGLTCSNDTDVIWYKGNKHKSCQKKGMLHLCQVSEYHKGVYFCDRRIREENITWTVRRAVHVKVGPLLRRKWWQSVWYRKASRDPPTYPPRITYPEGNMTEEVELGLPHNLTCEVFFPLETDDILPKVLWYMNYNGNMENTTLLHLEEPIITQPIPEEYNIKQIAIIKEVTPQHLKHTYTCSISNSVGNSNITIKLKRRVKVKWPCLVVYPVVTFLMVAMLGGTLHLKRLELQLIYRSYFQYGKHDTDEKLFDVFLSYVRSPLLTEVSESLTLSSRSGSSYAEEAYESVTDLLGTDDGANQRPLEVLLPQVLEDQWGYRLCLMDRDPLPGGAFTNDVVLAIERSRMHICVLSADYLTNSNAVFELESGIQALLQKSAPKLLLIWTSGASGSLNQVEPPLPTLVRRALRVLPSLKWSSSKPSRAKSEFWRSLRKAMPHHRR